MAAVRKVVIGGVTLFTVDDDNVDPNTDDGKVAWLKQRRVITASSSASKIGCCKSTTAQLEAWWDLAHPGEQKPDPEHYMRDGHVEEPFVADRCAPLLFPYREMLRGSPDYEWPDGDGLSLTTMYLHPLHPNWKSATPDRLVSGHPEKRVILEIKSSRLLLRPQPKVGHLFQVQLQLECMQSDFGFLGYGYKPDDGENVYSTALFLIQRCPELEAWAHKRHLIYYRYAQLKQIPPESELPALGYAVEEHWKDGSVPPYIKKDFPKEWNKPDFWPTQPKWQLVAYNVNEERCPNFGMHVKHYSRSGPCNPEIFQRAIGSIWARIGVTLSHRSNTALLEHEWARDAAEVEAHVKRLRGEATML